MQETRVWSSGQEDPQEKGIITHSSILAWVIPWTEKPGRLLFMGQQRVGHVWATNIFTFLSFCHALTNWSKREKKKRKSVCYQMEGLCPFLENKMSRKKWDYKKPGNNSLQVLGKALFRKCHLLKEQVHILSWELVSRIDRLLKTNPWLLWLMSWCFFWEKAQRC